MMGPRLVIRSGIAASATAHLSVLALVLFFSEVHPFGSVTVEPITVDIVQPADAPPPPNIDKKEELLPDLKPSDSFELPAKSQSANPPPSAPQPPAAAQQAAAPPQPPKQPPPQQRQPQPQPQQPQQALQSRPPDPQPVAAGPPPQQTPPQPASPAPGYVPPEPDISQKYHVLLGLPPELPAGERDAGDADASNKADIASSLITDFRRHLKTCSKLPASVSPSDKVRVKLRVLMTPDGKLAAEPVTIEGTASLKAFDLKQSAVDALQACQPYKMLPADRYGEWKVLDLNFTPQDFAGG